MSCHCRDSSCQLGRNRSSCLVPNKIRAADCFVGHSTFFWGDSTSLYLAIALEAWLRYTCVQPRAAELPQLADLTQIVPPGNKMWISKDNPAAPHLHFVHRQHCAQLPVRLPTDNLPLNAMSPLEAGSTHVFWTGWAGRYTGSTCRPEAIGSGLLAQLRLTQPSVLVFNFGLHWLHTTTYAKYEPTDPCVLNHWLAYEQHLTQVVSTAAVANVKLVVFKTTSRSCDSKWRNDTFERLRKWRRQNASWQRAQCARRYQKWLRPGSKLSQEGLDEYCANATFDAAGVARLNLRAVAHILEHRQRWEQEKGVHVAIFDDHAIQECDKARDSAHHWELAYSRLAALGDELQHWYTTPAFTNGAHRP